MLFRSASAVTFYRPDGHRVSHEEILEKYRNKVVDRRVAWQYAGVGEGTFKPVESMNLAFADSDWWKWPFGIDAESDNKSSVR